MKVANETEENEHDMELSSLMQQTKDAIQEHQERVAPGIQQIEDFISQKTQFAGTAKALSNLLSAKERPDAARFEDYKDLCHELIILLTNPKVSKKLPSYLYDTIGNQINKLKDFFDCLSVSTSVQAELDIDYLRRYYKTDAAIAEVLKNY